MPLKVSPLMVKSTLCIAYAESQGTSSNPILTVRQLCVKYGGLMGLWLPTEVSTRRAATVLGVVPVLEDRIHRV